MRYSKQLIFLGFSFFLSFNLAAQTFEWAKQISGPSVQTVYGMTTDAAGYVYVVGLFTVQVYLDNDIYFANGSDVWFAKFSPTGQYMWAKALVGGADDAGLDIAVDNSGAVYISGYFGGTLDFNPNPRVTNSLTVPGNLSWTFVAKYDTNGNYQWARSQGTCSTCFSQGKGIAADGNGNLFVVGDFDSQSSFQSAQATFGTTVLSGATGTAYFAKLNPANGDVQWAKNVGGNSTSTARATCEDVTITAGNNIYITGFYTGQNVIFGLNSTFSNSNQGTGFIAKYNSNGGFLLARQLTAAIAGNTPVGYAGMSVGNATNEDAFVILSNSQDANNSNIAIEKFEFSTGVFRIIPVNNPGVYNGGHSIDVQPDGSFYISGYLTGKGTPVNFNTPNQPPKTITVPNGRNDIFFARYNSNFTCDYVKALGVNGFGENVGKATAKAANGNLYLSGRVSSPTDFDPCFTAPNYLPNGVDGFVAAYQAQDSAPVLQGPNLACFGFANATFTISNLSPNAQVQWTQSGNLAAVSGQGTATYTVAPASSTTSGVGFVTATVAGPCGFTLTKNLWVGLPSLVYNPPGLNPCFNNPFYTGPNMPGLTYQWSVNNSNVWFTSPTNVYSMAVISYSPEYFTITLTISDGQCSTTTSLFSYTAGYYCQCFSDPLCGGQGFKMSVSPNPSQNSLLVTLPQEPKTTTTISLLNHTGKVVYKTEAKNKDNPIDVSSLPAGVYYILVEVQGTKDIERILIEH